MTQEITAAEQLDLTGHPIPTSPAAALPSDPEPAPKAVQLGLNVDVPIAVKLPRGLGVAYQETLTGEAP